MKKKKIDYNLKNRVLVVCALILFIFISFFSILKNEGFDNSFYKVEDRVDKLNKKKKEDSNVVGWIKVQGTDIDYPVVLNVGQLKYLSYSYGWVNNKEFSNNVVIFGHNVRNVSNKPLVRNKEHEKFEQLPSFLYYDFAKDNQFVQYTYNGKNYLYQIFSVSIVEEKFIDYKGKKLSKKNFEKLVAGSKYDSYFDYDVNVRGNDKVLSLVTCTRFYGGLGYDIRIVAKLIGEDQIGVRKKVVEKSNYKEIKEKMFEVSKKNAA